MRPNCRRRHVSSSSPSLIPSEHHPSDYRKRHRQHRKRDRHTSQTPLDPALDLGDPLPRRLKLPHTRREPLPRGLLLLAAGRKPRHREPPLPFQLRQPAQHLLLQGGDPTAGHLVPPEQLAVLIERERAACRPWARPRRGQILPR